MCLNKQFIKVRAFLAFLRTSLLIYNSTEFIHWGDVAMDVAVAHLGKSARHRQTAVWLSQTEPLAALHFATRKSVKPLTKGNVWQMWSFLSGPTGLFPANGHQLSVAVPGGGAVPVCSCVGIINNINTESVSVSTVWSHWPRPPLLSPWPLPAWPHYTGRPPLTAALSRLSQS